MEVWIDADAAPRDAKEIVYKAARRLGFSVCLVANAPQRLPPGIAAIRMVVVSVGPDEADHYMVANAVPGDLVITADIPLAARLVERSVLVLDPRGTEYSPDSMGSRLAGRNLMDSLRGEGLVGGGPPPYGPKERHRFAAAFDQTITRMLKESRRAAAKPGDPPAGS